MLDLHLFRIRRFAVSSGGITSVFFALFGTFFMLTQYLQGVLGLSPLGAAVRLLPISVVMMAAAPKTPKLVARFGANLVGFAGLTLVTLGMLGAALFKTDSPYFQVVVTMCILAAGMALTMTPMTTQLMASVPRDRAGMGSATNDVPVTEDHVSHLETRRARVRRTREARHADAVARGRRTSRTTERTVGVRSNPTRTVTCSSSTSAYSCGRSWRRPPGRSRRRRAFRCWTRSRAVRGRSLPEAAPRSRRPSR